MKKIIVGLDLNSSYISGTAASVDRSKNIYILGSERIGSEAITDGSIKDIDKATDDIHRLLKNLEKKTGKRTRRIYANINDKTVKGEVSRGMVGLAPRGRIVTEGDVRRCIRIGSMFNLPLDRELIHSFPRRFFVDDGAPVKNPVGLYGTKLSVEMYMITASVSSVQNIQRCVDKAGFILKEIFFSGLATSFSVLQKQEKEDGAMLVDIGRETTAILLFAKGVLENISVLPTGYSRGNKDLLETIKNEYVRSVQNDNIKSVVFTGEGALSEGLIEKAETALKRPAKIGIARNIIGNLNSAESALQASGIGIIEYVVAGLKSKREKGHWLKNTVKKTWDIIDSYF